MLKFHLLKQEELSLPEWAKQPLAEYLPGDFDPERALKRGDLLLAVFDEARLIGLLELRQEPTDGKPRCMLIEQTVLLPEYRRHGIGRMLTAIAAGTAAERSIWFLAARPPKTEEGRLFAEAMHFRMTEWYPDLLLLDLSDVEGMRHG